VTTVHERPLPPSFDGGVVLDIGGDVGALVLHAPPVLVGAEIDLVAVGHGAPRTHSAVRERLAEPGARFAAVYPALSAGAYVVAGTGQLVTVVGGRVTEADLAAATDHPADSPHH
jgi:hypothetical protein